MLPVWIVLMLLPILGGAERFNCRGRILGAYYADAKSGCKAFHVCVRVAGGGIRDFRFFCPPGTLFHQEAQTCTDWGDDDPLACPADLYDGQFDLYKIGSGYDTKKPSSPGNRDDETEFGLQRAETGDRRSQSNNAGSSGPASDLRAAHSSDFFSGQRDGGRDEPAPQTTRAQPSSPSRQSFRRPTSPRAPSTTTQYTTQSPPPPPQPSKHYDAPSKRKLVRKRPIYVSTASPTPFAQNTAQQSYSQQPQQNSNQRIHQSRPTTLPPANIPQYKEENYPRIPQNRPTTLLPAKAQYKEDTYQRISQNRPTNAPPANVPPQYKDEYVEVSRVTPKQTPNRYFPNSPTPSPFSQSTPAPQFKKEGLAELYNYEAQSTPGINVQNDNRPFKVRNSFSVSDVPREDFARTNFNSNTERNTPTTVDYNTATARGFATSTQAYKNFNSVSYESEKNNFVSFPGTKQNYFRSPTTTVSTTVYTTNRSDPLFNLNTVAYNTNIAFNTIQPSNYAETDEDDGQYRPTAGEDDGQYRPEVHERDRELLSGAHSLNIAASGNRLPEDQKPHTKSNHVKPQSHTSAPRPFRPAPTTTVAPTSRASETTYTTTYRVPTVYTQRTFDYVQTYTTTSRPNESPVPSHSSAPISNAPPRLSTTSAPRSPEPRPQPRVQPPVPPTIAPAKPAAPARPAPAPARPAQPTGNKEDASYDYAYYDSDPGFSEYDHIEEFGKTKSRA